MSGMTAAEIVGCFNRLFVDSHQVELIGGGSEPLYLPVTGNCPARIQFSHDYPSSALHEVAHWCIAGYQRRQCVDYGYWYQPPPRQPLQQQAFTAAESRVQALEAIFAEAANVPFRVSLDDIDNMTRYESHFKRRVELEIARFREHGLPARAAAFAQALTGLTGSPELISCGDHCG